MKNLLKRLLKEEEGQGMVEYALILCFISIAAIATIKLIGPKILTIYNNVNSALS